MTEKNKQKKIGFSNLQCTIVCTVRDVWYEFIYWWKSLSSANAEAEKNF